MPGLRRVAGLLAKGWRGDSSDRDGELLAGFLARLHTVDLDDTRIVGKLIDAAARAVKHARERDEDTDVIRVDAAWSLPPQRPFDHPDWVLARAVAAAVIDPEEHLLIGATRLEEVPLQVVADKLGISVALAAAWRRNAERRLVGAVATGELDRVSLVEAAARRRSAAAAANRSAAGGHGRAAGNGPPAVRPDTMTTPRNAAPASRWRQRAVVAGAAR